MNDPRVRGAIVIVLLVSATILAATGSIDAAAYMGLSTLILGYVFGKASNGVDGILKFVAATQGAQQPKKKHHTKPHPTLDDPTIGPLDDVPGG